MKGKVCIDIGASTGGFTDCMLKNGAERVYSVDVGYGQLAWELRNDSRVVVMERTNFRYVKPEDIGEKVDFAAADVSFISLEKIIPLQNSCLKMTEAWFALSSRSLKQAVRRSGKRELSGTQRFHREVIGKIIDFAEGLGFTVKGLSYSPIKGPEGNIEYLLYLAHKSEEEGFVSIDEVVEAAHAQLI